ncbi:MAG: NAD(P)-dependent oxidoreductase [Candidatus Verstraetearchaeota archaeon]|nr:NAD(P)-dependent oxidoreductase [Candidatus Verstraetearchaeota archaeon]
MKRVLVTGGRGFIGSHLVEELKRRGHEVWACDLMHSGEENYIRCDVSRYRQVERLFEEHDFDYVYHAAAEYGRWNGEDYYENLWMTNAVGTKNILKMQEKKRFRMVFFGSAEVYGDYDGVMSEDVMDKVPIKQMNDYAISKWVNELQIMNSAKMFGTETVRVRLFNVYGPGEHYTPYRGWIPKFIYKALKGEPYTVYLGHKRTLEYVEDICRALANIMDNFKPGEVYNLGGDEQYEIKYISDLILKTLGKDDSKVVYKESEPFTTRIKTPDSTKAKRDLNFKPTVPVEEGMRRTVEWFKKRYGEKP